MKKLSKDSLLVVYAYQKGYRVSEDGSLLAPSGEILELIGGDKRRSYLRVRMPLNEVRQTLHVHRLAAYQKFGDRMFADEMQVRHLNDNHTDNRLDNIDIGNQYQNIMDMPVEKRSASAKKINQKKKVPDEILIRIGEERQGGASRMELAIKYKMTIAAIGKATQRYRTEICGGPVRVGMPQRDINSARRIYRAGGISQAKLAKLYNVDVSKIRMIIQHSNCIGR